MYECKNIIMHRANVRKLYKTILRLHRALPSEIRELGDQYVRDEFRRHKTIEKEYVAPFMLEWSEYARDIATQIGLRGPHTASPQIGKSLPQGKLEDFESPQIYQLYELMKSIGVNEDSDVESMSSNASSSEEEINTQKKEKRTNIHPRKS